MLTDSQYSTLCRYRDSFIHPDSKPDDMTAYLCQQGFIRIKRAKYTIESECEVSYLKTFWEITSLGKQSMEDFENHRKKMADLHAEKERDRKFQLLNTLLSAVLGGIVTLLIEHFAGIIEFLSQFLS